MANRHLRTLEDIFFKPTKASMVWKEIESMLESFGAEVSEGRGSRVRILLNGVVGNFHRPHPKKEAARYQVEAVRDFLINAGVEP